MKILSKNVFSLEDTFLVSSEKKKKRRCRHEQGINRKEVQSLLFEYFREEFQRDETTDERDQRSG